ncbi:hypothetical protein Desgi_4442 [Desulfoscipio gibsoniae DSM 7213]|uniref:Uncharacterized protein n=2 Tax=Desulfoscipio gibsoniae TaxID=102134 RepID=R4KSV9_9FIRM|nr:hypothetical protein Desgi_4442 [Desulfoscipio gibsoniae DSM 7213]
MFEQNGLTQDQAAAIEGFKQYLIEDGNKYVFDGIRLTNIPGANVAVQGITQGVGNDVITEDNRYKVTITLPTTHALTSGTHVLQVSNVGEWAASTDSANRLLTQTINFNVNVDNTAPTAYLTRKSFKGKNSFNGF